MSVFCVPRFACCALIKGARIGGWVLLLAGLLSSCSSHKDKPLIAERELQATQAQVAGVVAPDELTQSLLQSTPLNPQTAPASKTTEHFDVAVSNVPARQFFLGLVNGTGVNLVVHPELSGTVSLNLKDVGVEDVLRVTRDIYGYEYKFEHGIYTIYPNEMRTQVFQINYLDVQRVGVSDTSVLIGRAQSNNNSGVGGGGDSSPGDTANLLGMLDNAKPSGGSSGSGLVPGSRVQTLNQTDFWGALKNTLIAIIGGDGDGRSVTVSPQAGMVVVKAKPQELGAVRDYLERSELSAKRQVILEAKILEVRLSKGFEAGVNWSAISGELAHTYNQGRDTLDSSSATLAVAANGTVSATQTVTDSITKSSSGLFSSLLQVQDISKLLSLLETQGSVQVLSSPRVSTVNNQKAVIRVGNDEYFITGISNNTTTNASATTSTPNIELSPFFSGISLDVTPQIAPTGEVILHIHPIVSDVTDQLKVFTVGDKSFSLPLALRGIRESDSIVKAENGQVIVLGGLMTEASNQQDGKRPLLGDIPLVNSLFRTKTKSSSKTELVILLRPQVVSDASWADQLAREQERMQSMGDAYRAQ